MKNIIKYGALFIGMSVMFGCNDLEEFDNSWLLENDEKMTLEASAESIKLDGAALDQTALTFKWTPAREVSDEYLLSYVTMLDVKTNQFNTSTMVRTLENDGVFEKSYTNEELQNLIVGKWSKSISEETTLSFKVIAKWEGGNQFIMPEVRTVDVNILPYRPLVFEADKVFLGGEAVRGIRPSTDYRMSTTPENEFIYAGEYLMKAGAMTIPIEYDGLTRYICPVDKKSVTIPDNDPVGGTFEGTEYNVTVLEIPEGGSINDIPVYNLPSEGYWRVIIDMEKKTVKFYSPKNRLEPKTVEFQFGGSTGWMLKKTLGTGKYYLNSMTGWDNWKGKPYDFVASQIDPQLLICSGVSINLSKGTNINIKIGQSLAEGFTILQEGTGTGQNSPVEASATNFVSKMFAFVPEGNVDSPLLMNQWMVTTPIVSNKRWVPEDQVKISKITIDIRNSRIRFD